MIKQKIKTYFLKKTVLIVKPVTEKYSMGGEEIVMRTYAYV